MPEAPLLDPGLPGGPIGRGSALLVNPFCPKDPHGSFGKHGLTPSLSLPSVAASTPGHWKLRYWDQQPLQGRPMPEAAGITVRLTFAWRAFQLADRHRQRGRKVILGGLHALCCPEQRAPQADARLAGEMARSGCSAFYVGFETLSDLNLAEARTPAAGVCPPRVRLLRDQGI